MDIETLAKKSGMITEIQSGAASCVWTAGLTAVSADQLTEFARLVAAEEREACAKAVEATKRRTYSDCCDSLDMAAKAIRKRSNVELSGPTAGLSPEGRARTQGYASQDERREEC